MQKLAGQGLLYIRIKKAYNFVLNETSVSDDDQLPDFPVSVDLIQSQSQESVDRSVRNSTNSGDDFFYTVVREFPSSNIMEPTEMLKYLQSKIVRGRSLDLSEDAVALSGETNFIAVDRENIFKSQHSKSWDQWMTQE